MRPTARRLLASEDGIALPLALLSSLVLAALAAAFLSLATMEPQIAVNLRDEARARHLADAGVDWALDRLAAAPDWSELLAAPALIDAGPLPGLDATAGTVAASVRNDDQATDERLTGVPADPGGAGHDTNGVVLVTATGTANGVSRAIQAVFRRSPGPGGAGATLTYWREL